MLRVVSEEKNNVVHATIRIFVNVIGDPMANPAVAGRGAWWTNDLCAPLLPNGRQWIPLLVFFSPSPRTARRQISAAPLCRFIPNR
jgi:hypothetical protein